MNEAIIVAIITGGAAIIGNIITARKSSREVAHKLEINQLEIANKLKTQQAVTDTKIDELTREVRAHNNFARRMPVVEDQIKTLQGTVNTLQRYHME